MNTKWIKLSYISPWTHEPDVCVLTSAESSGRWAGFQFAIFDKDDEFGAHVAFHPFVERVLSSRTLDRDEALEWLNATRYEHRKEIIGNFNEIYG